MASARDREVQTSQTRIRNRGARDQRSTTILRFSVARPSVVVFRVRREAPTCAVVGKFAVRARAGVNEVPFTGRLRGEPLPPGTYTVSAVARRNGRAVPLGGVTVVIVAPGERMPQATAEPSTCAAGSTGAGVLSDLFASASLALTRATREMREPASSTSDDDRGDVAAADANAGTGSARESARGPDDGAANPRSEVFGVVPNPYDDAPTWVQTFLFAALGTAILLVLVAALPAGAITPGPVAAAIARKRTELALAGAVGLAAGAMVAFFLY
jgi:hypothetical protein